MLPYTTPTKIIIDQRVITHLLIYSFLFLELLLEFGLGLTLRLRATLVLKHGVRFRVGVRIVIFLF